MQAAQNDQFSASRAWAAGSSPTAVRMCESGNNYGINTGSGYYGAWQFDLPSWYANGGGQFAGLPNYATKDQRDFVAYTYWQRAGWGPWSCKPGDPPAKMTARPRRFRIGGAFVTPAGIGQERGQVGRSPSRDPGTDV